MKQRDSRCETVIYWPYRERLSVGTHSQSEEGDILLSEQLMNPLAIDPAVDSMKNELE